MPADLIEIVNALMLLIGCALVAYPMAVRATSGGTGVNRGTGDTRTSVRAVATLLIGFWLLTVVFQIAIALGAFNRYLLCPGFAIAGIIAFFTVWRGRPPALQLRRDLDHLGQLLKCAALDWRGWLSIPVVGMLGLRWWRGSVAPPLSWDSLTYHLFKAGRWVQTGGWYEEAAPDAWGYYEHFPPGGDLLWAWAMLPGHTDGLIASAGVLIWLSAVLVIYALATTLGAGRRPAMFSALIAGVTPCILNYITSAYVDVISLVYVGAACLFAVRSARTKALGDWALTGAAMGLTLGVKLSAWPIVAVIGLFSMVKLIPTLRQRDGWHATAAVAAGLSVAIPMYVRTWAATGSPFYPLTVKIAGWTFLDGNEEMRLLHSGQLSPGALALNPGLDVFVGLFVKTNGDSSDFLNFGIGIALLSVIAIIGLWKCASDKSIGFGQTLLLAVAAVVVVSMFSEQAIAMRTNWSGHMGRYIGPVLLTVFALGALPRGRAIDAVRAAAVLGGLWYCIPSGYQEADWAAMKQFGAGFLPWLAAAAVIVWIGKRQARLGPASGIAATLVAAGFTITLQPTRQEFRYQIYESAADMQKPRAYDLHVLDSGAIHGWLFWRALDDGPSHNIAFVAGFDGVGHNWYRYGLLGSKLQNSVRYIPTSSDGTVVDYRLRKEVTRLADKQAWIRRLHQHRIETVIVFPPWSPEAAWLAETPELFRRLHRFAYRVLPQARYPN